MTPWKKTDLAAKQLEPFRVGLQDGLDGLGRPRIDIILSLIRGAGMPNRRLQDRIEALVTKALATPNPVEIDEILLELREALLEHAERLRAATIKPQSATSRQR